MDIPLKPVTTEIGWECTRCGDCCTMPLVVELTLGEYHRLTKIHSLPRLLFKKEDKYVPCMIHHAYNKKRAGCAFYDHDRLACSIYEKRPFVCQAFPFVIKDDTLMIDVRTAGGNIQNPYTEEQIIELKALRKTEQDKIGIEFFKAAMMFTEDDVEKHFVKHEKIDNVYIHKADFERFFG